MILEIKENITENLKNCPCDKCGSIGNFKKHGKYTRFLIQLLKTEKIKIKRVKCVSCGTTHALIPKDVIPYKQYAISLVVILFIMWADVSVRKKHTNLKVPETSRRRLVNNSKKDAAILLAIAINQNIIKSKVDYFTHSKFNVVCWEKTNRKFTENLRLNNLKIKIKKYPRGFT